MELGRRAARARACHATSPANAVPVPVQANLRSSGCLSFLLEFVLAHMNSRRRRRSSCRHDNGGLTPKDGGMANATSIERLGSAVSSAPPGPDLNNPNRSTSDPAGAGGGNRLGGSWGQVAVPHAVEHPFHCGDDLGGCRG